MHQVLRNFPLSFDFYLKIDQKLSFVLDKDSKVNYYLNENFKIQRAKVETA